jgi:polyphosphate kinase
VAPDFLRPTIIERIREQAGLGRDGRILLKSNHVVDPEIINELYAASAAGCPVELIVRGNCSVLPGVPGLSENVTVRSIVGRFLEHSRIYRFGNPDIDAVYYIGSADMMQRNLNNRVEALVPITDPLLRARLEEILQVALSDDVLAWEANPDGTWTKVTPELGIDTHQRLLDLAAARARGETPYPS